MTALPMHSCPKHAPGITVTWVGPPECPWCATYDEVNELYGKIKTMQGIIGGVLTECIEIVETVGKDYEALAAAASTSNQRTLNEERALACFRAADEIRDKARESAERVSRIL